jgi:hypothetical protein
MVRRVAGTLETFQKQKTNEKGKARLPFACDQYSGTIGGETAPEA